MLEEEALTPETLKAAVNELYENRSTYILAMNESPMGNSIKTITDMIEDLVS